MDSSNSLAAIKAVIVDDEIQGIKSLKKILEQHCPQIKILESFQSSLDALKSIPKLKPDLLFLDIRMPQLNGLELHELLGFDQYNIIYTTASDSSSDIIRALRFNAIDYLLKPVDPAMLVEAVAKIKNETLEVESRDIQNQKALEDWRNGINKDSRFGIKEGNKLIFEPLENIVYCKSDGNFTQVFLLEGKAIYSSYSMLEMEEKLKGAFIRIHREYLVNKNHIKELEANSILLTNRKSLPISRKRKKEVGDILEP